MREEIPTAQRVRAAFAMGTSAARGAEKEWGMNREEHLRWCKDRALEYLPDDPQEALASMFSDLGKHPETEGHSAIGLGVTMMMGGYLRTADQARKFIEGFN